MLKTIDKKFLIFAAILTFAKLVFISLQTYPLWVDEAQYWTWSKQLDFGYYSKPPIIAWFIYLSTAVFGDLHLGVRFFSPVMHFVAAIFVYKATFNLSDKNQQTSIFAGLIYILMPVVSFSGYIISTDVPLVMFWAIAFYYFTKTLEQSSEQNNIINWLLVGVFAGLAMLSKYTAIFFCFSLVLYALILNRKALAKPSIYFSALAFTVVFGVNLYWNYKNGFISFIHTQENVLEKSSSINFADFFEFLGAQILIFNPILFVVLAITIFKKPLFKKYLLLHLFTIPPVVAGLVVALKSGAQAHWAACAYVTASITVALYIAEFNKQKIYKYSKLLNIFLLVLVSLILLSFYSLNPNIKAVKRLSVWHDVAMSYVELSVKNPKAHLVSDERKVIAVAMHFFTNLKKPPQIKKLSFSDRPFDYYDMKYKQEIIKNEKLLLITRSNNEQTLSAYFSDIKQIKNTYLPEGFRAYLLEK